MTETPELTVLNNAEISHHASIRVSQRCIPEDVVSIVLYFADIEYPAAHGRRRIRLSQRRIGEIMNEGFDYALVNKARSVELIVGQGDSVVTALRCDPVPLRRTRLQKLRRSASVRRGHIHV